MPKALTVKEQYDALCKLQAKSKAVFRQQIDAKAALLSLLARSPDARISLGDGRTLVRTDAFADKNTVYKQTAIDRFDITVVGEITPLASAEALADAAIASGF
jgi:hypothetical protein